MFVNVKVCFTGTNGFELRFCWKLFILNALVRVQAGYEVINCNSINVLTSFAEILHILVLRLQVSSL